MRSKNAITTMELTQGSRIAIMGGGPAGSFTAYFLLTLSRRIGLNIEVTIFEPKQFSKTGAAGCNLCGGIISESLVQLLAADGIALPRDIIMDTLDSYTLHTDEGSVTIHSALEESRIAAVYRGGGPKGAESQHPLPWQSFDQYLLNLAIEQGAILRPQRVVRLAWQQNRPQVYFGNHESDTFDLLVGAVGLNGQGIHLFDPLHFGYQPPLTAKSWVCELYYGDKAVRQKLGHSMHIFLLDIPGLQFAALTPKGHYATFVILGHQIDDALVHKIFASTAVRSLLPDGWEIPVQTCHCQPKIYLDDAHNFFTDRVVLVGDCSISRLYKDGIGAAYRTAKACALTVITHGIAHQDFEKYYLPLCQQLANDNRLGHFLFGWDRLIGHFRPMRYAMLQTVRAEGCIANPQGILSQGLWDTFTGSASYHAIFHRVLHPRVHWRLFISFCQYFIQKWFYKRGRCKKV